MELGEKLRQARLEAGLSQRQLCGEEITRNMLSQIENGSARPSMKTLGYLASRLGKSVSYFLEETAVVSPNQEVMAAARQRFDEGDFAGAAAALESYREPDSVYDRERELLWALTHLALAEQALVENRVPYAAELLEKADMETSYCAPELRRRRLLLEGRLPGRKVSGKLPSLDEELLLRASEALDAGDANRAGRLLDAAEEQTAPNWQRLRGETWLAEKAWENAARCFLAAEEAFPKDMAAKLEICYRELGDYKRAYEYAYKKQRL